MVLIFMVSVFLGVYNYYNAREIFL